MADMRASACPLLYRRAQAAMGGERSACCLAQDRQESTVCFKSVAQIDYDAGKRKSLITNDPHSG